MALLPAATGAIGTSYYGMAAIRLASVWRPATDLPTINLTHLAR